VDIYIIFRLISVFKKLIIENPFFSGMTHYVTGLIIFSDCLILKKMALASFETSGSIQPATQRVYPRRLEFSLSLLGKTQSTQTNYLFSAYIFG